VAKIITAMQNSVKKKLKRWKPSSSALKVFYPAIAAVQSIRIQD
jgi:hypothetical protein